MTFYKMFMVGASAVLLLLIILGIIPKHHHQSFPPSLLEKPRLLDNYTMALNKALLFFDSQRSGVLPRDNNISWRGNSCTRDGLTTAHKNLVGGYYDAGDAVKFNFPASFAMTMLSWSVIEYRAQYEAAGELDHVKNIIKWGIDYFLKCFASESPIDHIVAQVGLGGFPMAQPIPNDHYCWMRPEDIDYPRPVSTCQSCSDLPAEMAAALASASLVFGDNVTYSEKLVHAAKSLFQFSMDHPGTYSILGSDAAKYYDSTNFHDEYVWGAAWMYYATGDPSYIEFATKKDNADFSGAFGRVTDYAGLSWDNKIAGALVLLSRLRIFLGRSYKEVLKVYHEQANLFMCSYLPLSSQFSRTRGGLILINQEDPHRLQYVVNAAFLAALYSDYLKVSETPGILCGSDFVASGILRNFSKNQVDYILGKNPQNMSYVVGYGIKYPLHVHHRGASIPHNGIKYSCTGGWKWRDTPKANPNTIVGALVAGPDENDGFKDNRRMMNYTEPRLAGNAGLVGALVALSGDGSIRINKSSMFSFVPAAKFPPPPPPPTPWIH